MREFAHTAADLTQPLSHGASFEPSIDYVVTKIPRFAFEKFPQADPTLTTQMKSVGEAGADKFLLTALVSGQAAEVQDDSSGSR